MIGSIDLGKSNPLLELNPSGTFTTMTVSYWASIEHLHAFAHGPSHREGWAWWDHYRQSHHDVGIYHETFFAPRGSWETIYENMHPTGMGMSFFPSLSLSLFLFFAFLPSFLITLSFSYGGPDIEGEVQGNGKFIINPRANTLEKIKISSL